jgi:hypothetical protein
MLGVPKYTVNKRAMVVDVTDKEVIYLFQDGFCHHRNFEDFGRRPARVPSLS